MADEKVKCCFCNKSILIRYANDPYPANKANDTYCCDDCNMQIVVPARLELIRGGIHNAERN